MSLKGILRKHIDTYVGLVVTMRCAHVHNMCCRVRTCTCVHVLNVVRQRHIDHAAAPFELVQSGLHVSSKGGSYVGAF